MKTISINEYLEVLGLSDNFLKLSKEQQKQDLASAWRKFVLENHPDKNKGNLKSEEIFKLGNEAREALTDYIENRTLEVETETSTSVDDELNKALNEVFAEFDRQQRLKEEQENKEFKEAVLKTVGILVIIVIVAVQVLGIPLLFLFMIAFNFLVGAVKAKFAS